MSIEFSGDRAFEFAARTTGVQAEPAVLAAQIGCEKLVNRPARFLSLFVETGARRRSSGNRAWHK